MIRGRKVIIRQKRMEDAANDYTWRRDEELARMDTAPIMRAPFSTFLIGYADEIEHESARRRLFAIDTLDGTHIGNCMFYNIDSRKKETELGIMIGDREYWDDGYGVDAVKAMVDHIFKTTSIGRIYLNTLEWNLRAQRCFKKCGFVSYKRSRRFNHTFITMEIHRSEWKPRQPQNTEPSIKKGQEF
ncbi:MAG: GNAT family N-acetyltransferase [Chloroflexota bacterium]|nr:GNAT family N-acetyltransferase [Chloroflexota bacterium]